MEDLATKLNEINQQLLQSNSIDNMSEIIDILFLSKKTFSVVQTKIHNFFNRDYSDLSLLGSSTFTKDYICYSGLLTRLFSDNESLIHKKNQLHYLLSFYEMLVSQESIISGEDLKMLRNSRKNEFILKYTNPKIGAAIYQLEKLKKNPEIIQKILQKDLDDFSKIFFTKLLNTLIQDNKAQEEDDISKLYLEIDLLD